MVALAAHASLKNIGHSQLLSHVAQVLVSPFELKGRGTCDHLKTWHFGEIVNQLFGETI
jgi:hypothetical protein